MSGDPSNLMPAVCLGLTLLIPLAVAGLALFNAGLGRSRSAAHAMLGSLAVASVAALVYAAWGHSLQGPPGKSWSWIGARPLLMHRLALDGMRPVLAAWMQMLGVAMAAIVPLGTGNDRWRLEASCLSTVLLAGWTYPLFAHWAYSGWLARLGYVDPGGAGAIQVVGGVAAVSMAVILGPRRGKYVAGGMPAAIPGHNMVLVLFACFLAWIGWLGLNGSGAVLFGDAAGIAAVAMAGMNTTLAAAAAALVSAGITRVRFGRPDASLCANGWTGGLVASSAGCAFLLPVTAILTGAVAGALVTLSVEWLDVRFGVDDPAGSISVHAVAGIWGIVAAGIFTPAPFGIQLLGAAVLVVIILPMTYGLNRLLNRFCRQRVAEEGEADGLDLYELGAEAYPEFTMHRERFRPR